MNWSRIKHSLGLLMRQSGQARAEYLKKHGVFLQIGNNCMVMFRKIPLYPKLISLGNNVWIASNVLFVTHDMIYRVLNKIDNSNSFHENLGCIDIQDNVFIGSNTTLLPNITIGPNTIIAAGSVVNKSIPGNGVYGGVPVRYICSMDEFINKRKQIPNIDIKKNKQGLTEETVQAVWKRFKESEEKRKLS